MWQLTRDLFAIAKFLLILNIYVGKVTEAFLVVPFQAITELQQRSAYRYSLNERLKDKIQYFDNDICHVSI